MDTSRISYPFTVQGTEPGPTSVIFAGIHGNEKAGIIAFQRILRGFTIKRGTVTFELGNIAAIEKNERMCDTNMNRMFRKEEDLTDAQRASVEFPRSRYLMGLLNGADALLDIHTSRNVGCPKFIICEQRSLPIADMLPFDMVCTGINAFEPGATDGYMDSLGKIGICVECGQHDDTSAPMLAIKSIIEFLVAMGHIDGEISVLKQKFINVFDLYLSKTDSFTFARTFKEFEVLPANTLIGNDGTEEVYTKEESIIVFPVVRNAINEECFLLAKEVTLT